MRFLHTMLRVRNLEDSIEFYEKMFGMKLNRKSENKDFRYTLAFIGFEDSSVEIELTYNWDQTENYDLGNGYGHIALGFNDIYETCEKIRSAG